MSFGTTLALLLATSAAAGPDDGGLAVRGLWKRAAYLETQKEDPEGARTLYQRIVTQHADSPEADRARKRLLALSGETPRGGSSRGRAEAQVQAKAARRMAENRVATLLRLEDTARRSARQDRDEQAENRKGPELPTWFTEELSKGRSEKLDRATLLERLVDRALAEVPTRRPERPRRSYPPEIRRRIEEARADGMSEAEIRRRVQRWLRDRDG